MNILVDELPQSAEIDGVEYKLNSDFRFGIYTMLAFEDNKLTLEEKVIVMLQNLFSELPNEVTPEFLEKAQWFLNCGESSEEENNRRLYSFSKDASLIFAAFRQTHGIDLQNENLHWWTFLSLFMDLGSETSFCNLVGLRKRYYEGKCTKEEKQAIRDMGDMFHVPQNEYLSLEDREKVDTIKKRYKEAKEKR